MNNKPPIVSIRTSMNWPVLPIINNWCISSVQAYRKQDIILNIIILFLLLIYSLYKETNNIVSIKYSVIWADFLIIKFQKV